MINKDSSSDDTDRTQAVVLEHLSPTFVRLLDEEAGFAKKRNGGFFRFFASFEGLSKPKSYDVTIRKLMYGKNAATQHESA